MKVAINGEIETHPFVKPIKEPRPNPRIEARKEGPEKHQLP